MFLWLGSVCISVTGGVALVLPNGRSVPPSAGSLEKHPK